EECYVDEYGLRIEAGFKEAMKITHAANIVVACKHTNGDVKIVSEKKFLELLLPIQDLLLLVYVYAAKVSALRINNANILKATVGMVLVLLAR
ncbi:hypothetical protein Tco_0815064, partial [Tanacetum coccineum]